jgi:transposase
MLRVEHEKWGQTPDDLRRLAIEAEHWRTRERFLALYQITQGSSATAWAQQTGRHDDTVQGWVHDYAQHGPEALKYRRTGGWPPFARTSRRRSVRLFEGPSPLQRQHR